MAKNDKLLLDGIIDDRVANHNPSGQIGEAFEYLSFEQILKEHDLSKDELLSGIVDGRGDGGIDGFFVLINGHLLQDPESFFWPRSNSELILHLITAKHHETFRQSTLDALIATLTELLDFTIDESNLRGSYSDALLRMRANLKYAYRKLSPRLSNFSVKVSYASRGDTSDIGNEVRSRSAQIISLTKEYFGSCTPSFAFIGAAELIELHRKQPSYTLELPFVASLAKGERYVVLALLSDYFQFVTDDGKLRRHLFESNVRDFMGLNRVNEDIKDTLEDSTSPDFWWLNNGVTILATSASITGNSIQASDIQIVNGLQTTESIYRHFQKSGVANDDRCILVKVIVSRDEAVRDAITRATNNQTDVELASLHATDNIQRNIEDILIRHGLYYERRKNYYTNQGHPPSELVTPLYVAAGYVALILKAPHKASSLRSKFMRSSESYEAVFNIKAPLTVWPKIARTLKRVDHELELLRPQSKVTDKFLKGWRYITALLLVSKGLGKFSFSSQEMAAFDLGLITSEAVKAIWQELSRSVPQTKIKNEWTSPSNVVKVCQDFATRYGIAGVEAVFSMNHMPLAISAIDRKRTKKPIPEEFVELVRKTLPSQPWKPGMHREVSEQLKCEHWELSAAIERLVDEGVLLSQRDGVLYDSDGNVVSFDAERVHPDTLELLDGKF